MAVKWMTIAATFDHFRQMLHPHAHAQCSQIRFHQCRGCARIPGRHGVVRLRRPLQRSTADAEGRGGPGNFVRDPVVVRSSCRLIGTYRSIPSCNRPAFLRLVRLLTVLIIAVSAMYQTQSLVANESIERSAGMNIAFTV